MKSKKVSLSLPNISYANQNLKNLNKVSNSVPIDKLDLSGNPITTFSGLRVFPSLFNLDCSNTQLMSFQDFPKQTGIKIFNCKKTPISHRSNLDLMAAITFGESIEKVNGTVINDTIKYTASKLSDTIRPFLVKGWIILGLNPVKILNIQTRKRKTFYNQINEEEEETPEAELENDNPIQNTQAPINSNPPCEEDEGEDVFLEDDDSGTNQDDNVLGETAQNENHEAIDENKNDEEAEAILRNRFFRLQESILTEMKRPEIIPVLSKSGRVSALSTFSSASSTKPSKARQQRPNTSFANRSQIKPKPSTKKQQTDTE